MLVFACQSIYNFCRGNSVLMAIKQIIIKRILVHASVLAMMTATAPVLYAETLGDAINDAVHNHPSVYAAKARRDAVKESVSEEKSAYYPTMNATASFGRVYADNTTTRGLSVTRGAGYSWYGDGRLALNQNIYDWSERENRVDAAKARYQSSSLAYRDRQELVAFQTTQSYIQLVRAQVLKAQAEKHLKAMKGYKDRIGTLVKDGGADESELSRAQDFVSLAENIMAQAEADYAVSLAGFEEVVGRAPMGDLDEPSMDLSYIPETIDDAVTMALANNPQVMAAQQDAQAAMYDRRASDGNLYPTLDAELSASKKDQKDLIGGESEDARALLKMNWDVSLGGGQLATRRRLSEQYNEARYVVEDLKRTIERDVKVAWTSMHLASRQKDNEATRLEAAKKTLSTYDEQYEGGQKKLLDLMTAKAQVFAADQAYKNFVYQELDAAFALKFLTERQIVELSSQQEG